MKAQEIADKVNSLHDRLYPIAEKVLASKADEFRDEDGKLTIDNFISATIVSLRDYTADLVLYSLIALFADDAEAVLKQLPPAKDLPPTPAE
jgi:hypothetical protein